MGVDRGGCRKVDARRRRAVPRPRERGRLDGAQASHQHHEISGEYILTFLIPLMMGISLLLYSISPRNIDILKKEGQSRKKSVYIGSSGPSGYSGSWQEGNSNLTQSVITKTFLCFELEQFRGHFLLSSTPMSVGKSGLGFALTQSIAEI